MDLNKSTTQTVGAIVLAKYFALASAAAVCIPGRVVDLVKVNFLTFKVTIAILLVCCIFCSLTYRRLMRMYGDEIKSDFQKLPKIHWVFRGVSLLFGYLVCFFGFIFLFAFFDGFFSDPIRFNSSALFIGSGISFVGLTLTTVLRTGKKLSQ